MTRWAPLALLLLLACEPLNQAPPRRGDGGAPPASQDTQRRVAERALPLARCAGSGLVPDYSGVFAVRFETVSLVGGSVPGNQTEVVTRYAVAQLCQDGDVLGGLMLVCAFDQSPIVDDTGTCAAQLPGDALVANLPISGLSGSVNLADLTAELTGWLEPWGLDGNVSPPEEPSGAGVASAPPVIDADEDGDPGVTVYGNGEVPTIAWVARRTTADFLVEPVGVRALNGITNSQTTQAVIGGPASRALRGRVRRGAEGQALFVRADGIDGSGVIDRNGDGQVQCAELGPWIGDVLAPPRDWPCQP